MLTLVLHESFKTNNMHKTLIILLLYCVSGQTIIYAKPEGEKKTCIDCHKTILEGQTIHPPAEEACDYCHEETGNKHPGDSGRGFKLTDDIPGLCFMCHEEASEKYVHAAFEGGECMMCHSPHSSQYEHLLLANPVSSLCFECHDEEIALHKNKHKPVSDGNCVSCHNPHQSKNRLLLQKPMPALCFSCHDKEKQEMNEKNIHPPFEDDCRNCHMVHGSKEKNLLDFKTQDLCFECHDDVNEAMKTQPVVHGALTAKNTCVGCHSPHASNQDMFLIKENVDLCLSCHYRTYTNNERKLSNIKKKVKKGKSVHAAIELNGCSGCHSPHTSVYPYLLVDVFPSGTYTSANPDNFAICFTCHDPELIELKTTTTATNFRNGNHNLHNLHINGEKARNCIDCHDMHGSENEHLISKQVMFGSWRMPITYIATETGGSCLTGCHSKKVYNR